MGRKVIGLSVDDSIGYIESTCIIEHNGNNIVTEEYETPYNFQVFLDLDEDTNIIDSIGIDGLDRLYKVIDKEDCLPDIGPLDYKEEKLDLDLKDVTLRELYKEVMNKIFK